MQNVKGFADMFSPQSNRFTLMEEMARTIFSRYGYEELRTPLMEFTDLFCRSIGTETDVVQKEMYTFPDRKDRSLTLRPEATAGVIRAYIQSKRYAVEPVSKFFSMGPMFRYERPQKGRMRQFHQLNCECFGAANPINDAEMIIMLSNFLEEIEITDFTIQINTLGCTECRPAYKEQLRNYLHELDKNALCEDCRRRMDTNPLRVLDCKVPSCQDHTKDAPFLYKHVCDACTTHFSEVLNFLEYKKLNLEINPRLVRGLDYYCRTTFEVVSNGIGAQTSIAGGGRYDGLVKQLGGPDISGIGFACGMERLEMLMPELSLPQKHFHIVYAETEPALHMAFAVAIVLRGTAFLGDMALYGSSFKSQMRQAGKSNALYALIIGDDEVENKSITVKDMASGEQTSVPLDKIFQYLDDKIFAIEKED